VEPGCGGDAVSPAVWSFWETVEWTGSRGLLERTVAHLELSLLAMAIAVVVAVPLAVVVGHTGRGGAAATAAVTAGRAVPTYAVIALLFPIAILWGLGLGFWPSVVALVLLAIPPLFTNTLTGIRGVEADLVEAARGMGMTGGQVLRSVEVPVALPLVLAGVRTATVQVMSTATLASIFGYQALGSYLTEGLAQRDDAKLLVGTLAVGALWLLAEIVLGLLQRWLTPWARDDQSARGGRWRRKTLADPSDLTGGVTEALPVR
jgi:osmoprotectant transport system permease protein